MNLTRLVVSSLLLSGLMTTTLFAQDPSAPGKAAASDIPWYHSIDPFDELRVHVRSDFGDGLGYYRGYTQVGVMQPIFYDDDQFLWFISPRGIVQHTGDFAANLGTGIRWYNEGLDRIFGVSAWYDRDDSSLSKYSQFGLSFESLGKYVDYRLNLYLPDDTSENVRSSFFNGHDCFIGQNIGLGRTRHVESALKAIDFEVGGSLPGIGNYGLKPHVGAYYYDGEGNNALGVKARTELLITPDLSAQVQVTNDRLFKTTATASMQWTFPSGAPRQKKRWFAAPQTVQMRMWEQMQRQWRMAVYRHSIDDVVTAIDPTDGNPLRVVHVDNTAGVGGNGTAENPYNFLPAGTDPNWDIVFVHRGDSLSTNMNGGITLRNNQRLLGEGVPHTFVSTQGTFFLPKNTSGVTPLITNLAGNAVTLANNNEVSGFRIGGAGIGPTGSGVFGNGISNYNLNNLVIRNAGIHGIQLVNTSGVGRISNTNLLNSTQRGLFVDNTGAPTLDLLMTDITASGNGLAGIGLASNGSLINATATRVNANANDTGANVSVQGAGTINLDTFNSSFNNNNGNGLTVLQNNGAFNLRAVDTVFNGNRLNGIGASVNNNSFFVGSFLRSQLSGNTTGNGIGLGVSASTAQLNMFASQANGNGLHGAGVALINGSLFSSIIDNSTLNGNVGSGLNISANASTIAPLTIRNSSTFNSNGQGGVNISLLAGSIMTATVNNSSTNLNTGNGFAVTANASFADVQIDTSAFNANTLNGLLFSGANNSTFITSILNSFADANGQHGICYDLTTSTAFVTIDNTEVQDNSGNGIHFINRQGTIIGFLTRNTIVNNALMGIRADTNSGRTDLTIGGALISNANLIAGNGDAGIGYFIDGISPIASTLNIGNNTIINNIDGPGTPGAGDGILVSVADNAILNLNIFNNFIDNNAGSGVQILHADESILTASITRNTLGTTGVGNGIDGINYVRTVSARLNNLTIQDNSIVGNADDGIDISVAGTANPQVVVDILSNFINSNGGNGINMNGINSAILNADIQNNTITNNTGNGINWTQGDSASVTGLWTNNTITGNLGNGIFLEAGANLTITNNTVTGNALSGLSMVSPNGGVTSNITVDNNVFSNNGVFGVQFASILGDTINVNSLASNTIANNGATGVNLVTDGAGVINLLSMLTNAIQGNRGNGMAATANSTSLINIVAMQGNVLRGNTLAGITLTGNQAGTIIGNIAGNTIDSNGGRGLDVTANGSSDIQLTFTGNTIIGNLGEGAMFTTNAGSLLTSDSLDIIFTNNNVIANGQPGDFGGLVFRIGSSEFGASRARVTNNTFAGNSGPDVYIESYTATPNPPVIPLPFGPYPDPLARFDLKFIDNVGEEADVTNFGAFYNNADPLKSPIPPPITNPFVSLTRLRNAQRQVGVVAPFVGLSGTGQSTFRVEADGSVAGFTSQLSTFASASPLGFGADEFLFPFVWNIVPVGSLFP